MQVKVLTVPAGVDLTEFAAYLWEHKIPHRIRFNDGQQEIWTDPRLQPFVEQQFQAWQSGEALRQVEIHADNGGLAVAIQQAPITIILITAAVVVTLVTNFGHLGNPLMHWLTFVDFRLQGTSFINQSLMVTMQKGELWRWFTPALLHFNLLHIIFNGLWIWELGRRIEQAFAPVVMIWLVLFIAVVSNYSQFILTGPLFGGLSGVVYGFIGFTFLWDKICPERKFGLPSVLMTFMLIWLLVGVSGLLERLGMPGMANAAHTVGLLCGLAAVPVVYYWRESLWRR